MLDRAPVPTLAVPLKACSPDRRVDVLAERTGTLACEFTFTPSSLREVVSCARAVVSGTSPYGRGDGESDVSGEVRFHARAMPALDFALPGEEGEGACVRLRKAITEIGERFGPTYLTIHSGIDEDELDMAVALERLANLRDLAASRGIVLCLENLACGWTSNPSNLVRAAQESGVRLTVDIGHINSCENCRSGTYTRRSFIEEIGVFVAAAHVYEYEDEGHRCDHDCALTWDALEALLLTDADWWVVELFDEDAFAMMLEEVEAFLAHAFGSRKDWNLERKLSPRN